MGDRTLEIEYEVNGICYHAWLPTDEKNLKELHHSNTIIGNVKKIYPPDGVQELIRLKDQVVDLHEVNYLAKRLLCMDNSELKNFNVQLWQEKLDTVRDMINASFMQGKYCLVDDFSIITDKQKLGSLLYKTKNLCWNEKEFNETDMAAYADEIIKQYPPRLTPYGSLYQLQEEMETVYTGTAFPAYDEKGNTNLRVVIRAKQPIEGSSSETEFYLPASDAYIDMMLDRIGIPEPTKDSYEMEFEFFNLEEPLTMMLNDLAMEDVYEANILSNNLNKIKLNSVGDNLILFGSALEASGVKTVKDTLYVAENLYSYEMTDTSDMKQNARNYLRKALDDNPFIFELIDEFIDYDKLSTTQSDYAIAEVTLGYILYPTFIVDQIEKGHACTVKEHQNLL